MPAATVDVSSTDDPVLGAGADAAGIERCEVSTFAYHERGRTNEDTGIGSLAVSDALSGLDRSG